MIKQILSIEYKIVYITPETLNEHHDDLLKPMYQNGFINRFAIDEIHLVKIWGEDFRYDFIKLNKLRNNYPDVPILGLTATLEKKYIRDIEKHLGMFN